MFSGSAEGPPRVLSIASARLVLPKMLMPIAYWVHELSPFLGPHWGNFGIRYYGLGYVLGFLAAAWLLARYARAGRSQLPSSKIGDLMVALVFGVMLGGRLGSFLLYQPDSFLRDPLSF